MSKVANFNDLGRASQEQKEKKKSIHGGGEQPKNVHWWTCKSLADPPSRESQTSTPQAPKCLTMYSDEHRMVSHISDSN